MLGFAIVDRQPTAGATAVWVTSRIGSTRVNNTNAVVIAHDDPEYDMKVRALTAGRSVVLTTGTVSPVGFVHAVHLDTFDDLIRQTATHQDRICEAISDYNSRNHKDLVIPRFPPTPVLAPPNEDEPQYRALAVADYAGEVWAAWLFTDEQRHRRTMAPKTGESPWIMPAELNSQTIAILPDEFADRVQPEPLA
ncbi:MAG: hypothetical protein JWN03_8574 [Nocardia sp.]|uniref:hypothetical protein n=1 Tax=Nocardia sp. TaxID=1821 RepID=UPI0026236088|nr:hypothetical protein [Nocardia sp.]MCU1648299.1 hypothetical protein [Nocardia sp.]